MFFSILYAYMPIKRNGFLLQINALLGTMHIYGLSRNNFRYKMATYLPCLVEFSCSALYAHFYTTNSNKIGDIASKDVILQLIKSKCIPSLLYGFDACALTKSELCSLDFSVNRFFTKLFKTNNIDVVKSCQLYFGFSLPSEEWVKRAKNLDTKYIACERAFVYYGSSMFH